MLGNVLQAKTEYRDFNKSRIGNIHTALAVEGSDVELGLVLSRLDAGPFSNWMLENTTLGAVALSDQNSLTS